MTVLVRRALGRSSDVKSGPSEGAAALVAERCAALICLLLAAGLGLCAESLVTQSSVARPGALPPHAAIWLGAGVLGLASLVWTWQAFRRRQPLEVPDLGRVPDALRVFGLLALGAWATQWLGLLLAGGLTYLALLVFYKDRSRLFILLSTAAYLLLLHYGLEVLLGVPLPRSPLIPTPF